MRTHKICFCREVRKLFTLYPLLSRPMKNGSKIFQMYVTYPFCMRAQIRYYLITKLASNTLPEQDFG